MDITLVLILLLSLGFNILLLWGVLNLVKKVERFEDYFNKLQNNLTHVYEQITSVDINGAFSADDEVGVVFSAIKQMIYTLNDFILTTNDHTNNDINKTT